MHILDLAKGGLLWCAEAWARWNGIICPRLSLLGQPSQGFKLAKWNQPLWHWASICSEWKPHGFTDPCMHGMYFFQLGAHMHESSSSSCELRMVLLCLLCVANHAIFLVEQPRQSLLYNYFRWQWLQKRVCWVSCVHLDSLQSNSTIHAYMHSAYWHPAALQVYQVSFWLMKYGAPSPKRLMLRSNWHDIVHMDLGRLPRKQAAAQTTVKTSRLGPNNHMH